MLGGGGCKKRMPNPADAEGEALRREYLSNWLSMRAQEGEGQGGYETSDFGSGLVKLNRVATTMSQALNDVDRMKSLFGSDAIVP